MNKIEENFNYIQLPKANDKEILYKDIDYFVNEFFLIRSLRGRGIAERAANIIFDQFSGKWELFTNPSDKNITGQKFWRKIVSNYTNGDYSEESGETFDGQKIIFRFNNR